MFWNNNDNIKSDNNKNSLLSKYNIHPFAGLWSGVGELLSQPGQYYVQANWKGNGLANTGVGYLVNPNYRDFFSAGQALAALGNLKQNSEKNKSSIVNSSASGLWSTGENLSNIIGPTYQLSQEPYYGIDISLPTTYNYNRFHRPSWEK